MAHPRAEDSLEGIVEWWLLEQKIEVATEEVRQAIESLVANEFLIERETTDSQLRYHVNPDKLDEVREVLAGTSDVDRENDS
jgi:flagellar biosynthesis/type III secretory pathway protein FliH